MSEQGLLEFRRRACEMPEVNQHLTQYCFGAASDAESRLFAAHLLECDFCWDEVQRLSSAVQALRSDPEIVQMYLPNDMSEYFGVSAKLKSESD